ncbi:histidine phosphatase family protein [Limobrevibacterium gyesilva]|uniref:Phosphoglycerate mutase family protein n=1 Tax=Limobrevibacterium gyesilva TaxID=2991712 RepID=A0AA41YI72_9PROT|nr:histidine phosphatase family protein [Limobrevibacterium gyesilva]MCW3473409.1 phosphoglycerate mutase family protein [Limobrevibacterium gyesilva]
MPAAFFITHPDVQIDPAVPVPDWPLSSRGRARMRTALARPWVRGIRAIHASTERKAVDAAMILARGLDLEFTTLAALGENDRSATGYLPRAEFEATADAFFARPLESVRGWERAVDAQARIVGAVEAVLSIAPAEGDIAIVSHGAVGALLICALEGLAISRSQDQPPGGGGYYYAFDLRTRLLRHDWTAIDA